MPDPLHRYDSSLLAAQARLPRAGIGRPAHGAGPTPRHQAPAAALPHRRLLLHAAHRLLTISPRRFPPDRWRSAAARWRRLPSSLHPPRPAFEHWRPRWPAHCSSSSKPHAVSHVSGLRHDRTTPRIRGIKQRSPSPHRGSNFVIDVRATVNYRHAPVSLHPRRPALSAGVGFIPLAADVPRPGSWRHGPRSSLSSPMSPSSPRCAAQLRRGALPAAARPRRPSPSARGHAENLGVL